MGIFSLSARTARCRRLISGLYRMAATVLRLLDKRGDGSMLWKQAALSTSCECHVPYLGG